MGGGYWDGTQGKEHKQHSPEGKHIRQAISP
jgi:hypothetical protein